MKTEYKSIGVVTKPNKEVLPYLNEVISVLQSFKKDILLDNVAAKLMGSAQGLDRNEIARASDLLILIGGDGTFLSVAKKAVKQNIPVAGFNLGTMGFLTELKKENIKINISKIFKNQLPVSKRKILAIIMQDYKSLALNDVVIAKGNIARIIKIRIEIDGSEIAEIKAQFNIEDE